MSTPNKSKSKSPAAGGHHISPPDIKVSIKYPGLNYYPPEPLNLSISKFKSGVNSK